MVVVFVLFVTVLAVFVGGWLFAFLVLCCLVLSVCVYGVVLLCPPSPLWLFDVLFVPPSFVLSMFVHCGVCVPMFHSPPSLCVCCRCGCGALFPLSSV